MGNLIKVAISPDESVIYISGNRRIYEKFSVSICAIFLFLSFAFPQTSQAAKLNKCGLYVLAVHVGDLLGQAQNPNSSEIYKIAKKIREAKRKRRKENTKNTQGDSKIDPQRKEADKLVEVVLNARKNLKNELEIQEKIRKRKDELNKIIKKRGAENKSRYEHIALIKEKLRSYVGIGVKVIDYRDRFPETAAAVRELEKSFEEIEVSVLVIEKNRKEIETLQLQLPNLSLIKQVVAYFEIKAMNKEISEKAVLLGEHYSLYLMGHGFLVDIINNPVKNNCSAGCVEIAQDVLDSLGLQGGMALAYKNLLKGRRRPTVNRVKKTFDSLPEAILAKVEIELRFEKRALLLSRILAEPFLDKIELIVNRLDKGKLSKWVKILPILHFLHSVRDWHRWKTDTPNVTKVIRLAGEKDHIYELFFDLTAKRPALLLTLARLVKTQEVWKDIKEMAETRQDPMRIALLKKAEEDALKMGPLSSLHPETGSQMFAKFVLAMASLTGIILAVDDLLDDTDEGRLQKVKDVAKGLDKIKNNIVNLKDIPSPEQVEEVFYDLSDQAISEMPLAENTN